MESVKNEPWDDAREAFSSLENEDRLILCNILSVSEFCYCRAVGANFHRSTANNWEDVYVNRGEHLHTLNYDFLRCMLSIGGSQGKCIHVHVYPSILRMGTEALKPFVKKSNDAFSALTSSMRPWWGKMGQDFRFFRRYRTRNPISFHARQWMNNRKRGRYPPLLLRHMSVSHFCFLSPCSCISLPTTITLNYCFHQVGSVVSSDTFLTSVNWTEWSKNWLTEQPWG